MYGKFQWPGTHSAAVAMVVTKAENETARIERSRDRAREREREKDTENKDRKKAFTIYIHIPKSLENFASQAWIEQKDEEQKTTISSLLSAL